ncbi:phosphoadenylyl-sulfate reductase [Magnetovibrio sp.]|uniref:phosphoadenylyl-sulfate reductase n=1 Tax=Magnetovibrio sp. TaxID=2024836 RepID=UPI002F941207
MNTALKSHFLRLWQKRGLEGLALLRAVLAPDTGLKVAVSSSFGAESAVLLDLVAQVDAATPVLTVDTGKLFDETVAYRERLVDHFGLSDVRVLQPSDTLVASADPDGLLHQDDPDACCQVRKVMPHAAAAADFDVLITGRKRFHGGARGALAPVHKEGLHLKVNPLASWGEIDIETAFVDRALPRHPLVAADYRSIGCAVCTFKTGDGDGVRAGRWAGKDKTECGLHMTAHEPRHLNTQETGQ